MEMDLASDAKVPVTVEVCLRATSSARKEEVRGAVAR